MPLPASLLSYALPPLCSQLRDEELSKESQESNWFSAPSALRVYGEKMFQPCVECLWRQIIFAVPSFSQLNDSRIPSFFFKWLKTKFRAIKIFNCLKCTRIMLQIWNLQVVCLRLFLCYRFVIINCSHRNKVGMSLDGEMQVKVLVYFISVSIGQYLNLDKDHNGMLSKEELSRYGTATLTSVFLDRVFQECLTYDGEMVHWAAAPVC